MNSCRKVAFNGIVVGKKCVSTINRESSLRSFRRFSYKASTNNFDMAKEKTEFMNALPGVIDDLAKHPKYEEFPIARDWMKKVLSGTLTGGKIARGLTTVMSYKIVENPDKITEETIRLAHALGWCIELAYCVVLDDIIDGSSTRRGMPCWYRREDVGITNAINDATLIYYSLHQILQNNFAKSPIYVDLYQAFNETLFYTSIGQFLDMRGSNHQNNFESFTKENYEAIIQHKASYYTFKLPISVGLMLANHTSKASLSNCEDISLQLGKLFQIQDDYIDCFGDENLTGKIGTDIQEGKCTWLAVNALLRCSAKTRTVFTACYGSKEPAHVERIKQLYIQLQIPKLYKEEERHMYDSIKHKIESIPSAAERVLFQTLLDLTYDRKK